MKRDATKIQELAKAGIARLADEKMDAGARADVTGILVDIAATAAVMDARTGRRDPSTRKNGAAEA